MRSLLIRSNVIMIVENSDKNNMGLPNDADYISEFKWKELIGVFETPQEFKEAEKVFCEKMGWEYGDEIKNIVW